MDKGLCAQKNYRIVWYKILPFIFPKKNVKRVKERLSHPFEARKNRDIKRFYDWLFSAFESFLSSWENFKAVRSIIEDMFKVLKNSLSLKYLHRYFKRSVAKFTALCVLLLGMLISMEFNKKEKLQALAESRLSKRVIRFAPKIFRKIYSDILIMIPVFLALFIEISRTMNSKNK